MEGCSYDTANTESEYGKVKKNSLDWHPIQLSFVRHSGFDLQHSPNPPWRHQDPPWGAGTTPGAARASLLQSIGSSVLRPQGEKCTFPEPGPAQLPCLAPHPGTLLPWTGLAPDTLGESPEDSQDTAAVHSFLPKNRNWPSSQNLQVTTLPLTEFNEDFGYWKSTEKNPRYREENKLN